VSSLVMLASWSGLVLVAGFALGVLWRFVDGTIDLAELLDESVQDANGVAASWSWGRAQAFVVSLFATVFYVKQVAQDPTHFPEIPPVLLASVGASHAVYLGGKLKAALIGRARALNK